MEEEPNPVHSPPQNSVTPLTNDRYERIMSNLRASVFSKISPSGDIAPQIKTYIEKRLREFFPSFHTPSHPPYASETLQAMELKQHKDQKTSLEREVEMGFNKQDEVQDFVTQNLDYDHPAVEEEKQLQITSPCEKREIICGLLSHQYEQQQSKPRGRGRPRKLKSDTDMIKKSLLPSSDHGCNEQQQQLEGPGNGRCPVPESNLVADATTSSHSHDQNHNEQQQPLRKTGGRLPKRKRKCC
ncbi:hypothetical protein GH714_006158 [Hevea brasiliensis]|uniref:Uncharacterized protein n=1 Tax=Hevea brasiliensis TaxID=3981 RepID=A0A6A6LZ52_HEVBR|nr:hypothetical protein GH714_006158 [Hevea brasiliensis]